MGEHVNHQQVQIEERWESFRNKEAGPAKTMQEFYGDAEDWYMELGPYQLMLEPVNGTWLYYDRIHDQWSDSGYKPGQVIFSLSGEDIVITEREDKSTEDGSPVIQPLDETTCQQCGEKISSMDKFCPYCGNKINAPAARACKNCGSAIKNPQAKFCNECGSHLE